MLRILCQLLLVAWVLSAAGYSWVYYKQAKEAGEENPQALLKSIGKGIVFPLTLTVNWVAELIAKFRGSK